LQGRFQLPGWHLESLRWPSETTASLTARGPCSAHVELRFQLGVRGNRSQVGVDVQTCGDQPEVRIVAEQLTGLLRETRPAPSPPELSAAGVS
jgi:hypothetical protein